MKSSLGWLLVVVASATLLPAAAAETVATVAVNERPVIDSDHPVAPVQAVVEELQEDLPVDLPSLIDEAADLHAADSGEGPPPAMASPHGLSSPPGLVDRLKEPGTAASLAGLTLLLGALTYAGLFSRIQPNRMLENGVRNRVYQAVVHNPGVTLKEIVAVCGIGWGTAVYHLDRLENERLVVSERNRQFRRFFKNGGPVPNQTRAAFVELKNPTGQRIAEAVRSSPGVCQKELCARIGISPPLAHKYLSRLEAAGLVSAQRDWKLVKYHPTPELEALLLAASPPVPAPLLAPIAVVA